MGQVDPTLALVTDLLRRAARSHGEVARVGSVLALVGDLVDAEVGLLVQCDATRTVVRVIGRGMPAGGDDLVCRELERLRARTPLLDPVTTDDLSPRTAQRAYGPDVWPTSEQRADCLRMCGADQVVTLPLVGGPQFVVAMFARVGEDFSDEELQRLTAIRPVVADVVSLVGLSSLEARPVAPRLTARESEVLRLLARGHTGGQIARELGTSPRTVEVHLGRIYTKLGVRDRLAAVLAAYDLGLVPRRSTRP